MNRITEEVIRSKLLEKFANIRHGFGTKHSDAKLLNVVTPHQVHGDRVVWIDKKGSYEADGLVTDKKGIAIGVRTADCVPILLYEPVKRIVAAVHAGWKGTAMNIASKAVKTIENRGGARQEIIAVIGPHIGACCYRVNTVRLNEMGDMMNSGYPVTQERDGNTYVDLGETNKEQLKRAGVSSDHIDLLSYCTHDQKDLFFSYRRDKTEKRMVSFIALA